MCIAVWLRLSMFAKGKSLRRHQVHYRGPDTLHDVDFKERDSKRFAECGRPPGFSP